MKDKQDRAGDGARKAKKARTAKDLGRMGTDKTLKWATPLTRINERRISEAFAEVYGREPWYRECKDVAGVAMNIPLNAWKLLLQMGNEVLEKAPRSDLVVLLRGYHKGEPGSKDYALRAACERYGLKRKYIVLTRDPLARKAYYNGFTAQRGIHKPGFDDARPCIPPEERLHHAGRHDRARARNRSRRNQGA